MIEQSVMDRYIAESSLNMTETSRINSENLLTRFFNLKPSVDFVDLRKADLIEMYSQLNQHSINGFITHKSKINDFAKWMYEQGYGSIELLHDISDLKYSDINHDYLYDIYYFRDIEELWSVMSLILKDKGTEFDTFKAAALLTWLGIDLNDMTEILKTDLDESNQCIIHPVTREVVEIPPVDLHDMIFSFLINYRDADSCDTKKFGGGILPYANSQYLLRSYKSAHLTVVQLRKTSDPVNQLAKKEEAQRIFQWNKIYLSGLYYRIYQYEQRYGSIEKDVKMLDKFFLCNQKETVQKLVAFDRKYKEYQTFIKCKMRLNA